MSNYIADSERGKPAEEMAALFLRGIDFDNLQPYIQMADMNGKRTDRPLYDEQEWESQPGENKNRDYIVKDSRHPDGMKHEIKTDFRAMTDGERGRHTGNVCIEVNPGCIKNLDVVKDGGRCIDVVSGSAWFDPNDGRHADFYHFFVPLVDLDGKRREIEGTNAFVDEMTEAEIRQFMDDERIPDVDSIITRVPLEFYLIVRWDKLKEFLERFAGIEFCEGEETGEKALIVLPLREMMKELKQSARAEYDGRIAVAPFCRTASKTRGATFIQSEGRLWISERLYNSIAIEDAIIGNCGEALMAVIEYKYPQIGEVPPEVGEILKRVGGECSVRITYQIDGIEPYTYCDRRGRKGEFQYISTVEQVMRLPRY